MPKIDLAEVPAERGDDHLGAYEARHLGAAGGLTQFGVVLQTLAPDAASSDRHWHEEEDEFLWVLEGRATLAENAGETSLEPGDAAAWQKGVANAHRVINRGAAPLRFLVAGWRAPRDVVHYPDRGGRAVIVGEQRRIEEGDAPGPADLSSGRIDPGTVPVDHRTSYPPPHDAAMAGRGYQMLGDAGGLTQFGVNLTIVAPGGMSSLRHWHSREDEFAMVTQGELVLVEDQGETMMRAGDCAAFPAGAANGHHFVNRSGAEARFLVVGGRDADDVCTYSDVDMKVRIAGGRDLFTRRDGRPLEQEG